MPDEVEYALLSRVYASPSSSLNQAAEVLGFLPPYEMPVLRSAGLLRLSGADPAINGHEFFCTGEEALPTLSGKSR